MFASSQRVLEIASGSGEHVEYFAPQFPNCRFYPSDIEDECLRSIAARSHECDTKNIATPSHVDVTRDDWSTGNDWPDEPFDLIFSANMIHIAPWQACEGLMRGAPRHLRPGGWLVLYGPFMREGVHTAPSNEAFSADLQRRNPSWGVRDIEVVTREAASHGLTRTRVVEMPANNLTVFFERF